MAFFFFSYAFENYGDLLTGFLNDLRDTVCDLAGCTRNEAAFYDAAQQPGDEYPAAIQEALLASSVMIAMYSPNYFGKQYCGKEFAVFLDRRKGYMESNPSARPTSLIPIQWVASARHIPFPVRKFFVSREKDSPYEKRGLKYILEQGVASPGERREWYVKFKYDVAEQILSTAARFPLPALANMNWPTRRNAFDARRPRVVIEPAEWTANPKSATFLYVGQPDEWEWTTTAPYAPPAQNSAGFVSAAVAESNEVEAQKVPFAQGFTAIEKLAGVCGRVVVIVSTNALLDGQAREWLRAYDARRYRHCATVIVGPGGASDDDLRNVFANSRSRSGAFFNRIPDAGELGFKIEEGLETLRIELASSATARQSPAQGNGSSLGAFPQL